MVRAFLVPFILHFGLVAFLFAWLTLGRLVAVRRGEAKLADFRHVEGDPPSLVPIARNLSNQFQLPTIAWFSAALLIFYGAVGHLDVAAAWVFLVGRVIHTFVQTMTGNVGLRGIVFLINAAGVLFLSGHLAWLVLWARIG